MANLTIKDALINIELRALQNGVKVEVNGDTGEKADEGVIGMKGGKVEVKSRRNKGNRKKEKDENEMKRKDDEETMSNASSELSVHDGSAPKTVKRSVTDIDLIL